MTFKEKQYDYQYQVAQKHPEWFNNDKCGGKFRSRVGLPDGRFILLKSENNLYPGIRTNKSDFTKDVKRYFRKNKIGWWGGFAPTAHMCSSQIACVNHLFFLRNDREAVLALANSVAGGDPFDDVLQLECDEYNPGFIAFEVVTKTDHLNEAKENEVLSRGSQCTSIDAVILAKRRDKVWLLPIEWKFVEEYGRDDKSKNVFDKKTNSMHNCGDERIRRYFEAKQELVPSSDYIVFSGEDKPRGSIFFQEPYYQLMRQTLWAEQAIKNNDPNIQGASDYIHIHVVPEANDTLRNKVYRKENWDHGEGMVATWKSNLKHPEKYVCIDPRKLFAKLEDDENLSKKYADLLKYLKVRYWGAK